MSTDAVQILISLGGLILAMIGLPALFLQLRDVKRSVRSEAYAALYELAADFRERSPILRRHLTENREPYSDSLHRSAGADRRVSG